MNTFLHKGFVMLDNQSNNRRIAKNTAVIYLDMLLAVLIGLYTSRLALKTLGISDYGLFSVVGGIIGMFAIISSSLSSTTTRFVNVEMGRKDGDLNKVFNVCNVLHIIMAIILFLFLETGGVYYIHHILKVETGKELDAMFVFQVSTAMCSIGILNVPYSSLFNATEKFLFIAIVNLSVRITQLLLLICISQYDGNRLRAYSLMMTLSTLTSFIIYHCYCYIYWHETVKWRFVKELKLYKEMLIFSCYNIMSVAALMSREQGSMLLINNFGGTTANGAFALARTMCNHVSGFAKKIQIAACPQMTQSYSSGCITRTYQLVCHTGKYGMLLMVLIFFPMWAELDFILQLWLDNVPVGASLFCRLMLLMVFFAVTDAGISQIVNASGKVAKFKTAYSILTLSCIPIGFVVLSLGASSYKLLIVFLLMDIVWRIVQLILSKRVLHLPMFFFLREMYYPVIKVCLVMSLTLWMMSFFPAQSTSGHIIRFFIILLAAIFFDYHFGLEQNERRKFSVIIREQIARKWEKID